MNDQRQAISEAYLADEDGLLGRLIPKAKMSPAEEAATAALARALIAKVRALRPHASGVDAFTQEYALSSDEGVMLMCLAEALLRVPDADTQDRLIRDKLAGQDWERHLGHSHSPFVNASTWALMLTGRIVEATRRVALGFRRHLAQPRGAARRTGDPAGGHQRGQACSGSISFSVARSRRRSRNRATLPTRGFRFSFDMLGEAAMTRADAKRYLERYRHAVRAVGAVRLSATGKLFEQPGISVKLTALHPRFEYFKRNDVLAELLPSAGEALRRGARCRIFRSRSMPKKPSVSISCSMCSRRWANDEALKGWDGLGLAVQAYQKRALPLIAWLTDLARRQRRIIPVRLVKGAYWDSEIKRGQELGLADYPVFTRKIANRCFLSRLCSRAARGAASDLSAIRHAQRPHAGCRRNLRRREPELRVPAPARHGRSAVRALRRRHPAGAHGRLRHASTRRSAATRTCCPILCDACWRTVPTHRSSIVSPMTKRRSRTSSPIRSSASSRGKPKAKSAHRKARSDLFRRGAIRRVCC